jgi:hypothetical protein
MDEMKRATMSSSPANTPEEPKAPPKNDSHQSFKLLLLILMVLQNSSTVLVGRHTRSSVPAQDLYIVNHLIIVTELGKV